MKISWSALIAAFAIAACGGSSASSATNDDGGTNGDAGDDSSAASVDGGADSAPVVDGALPPDPSDGTPTRQACGALNGTALTMSHGRIDGYLVSIVPIDGSHACNGDSTHVHLQVKMNNAIYDVAVNADTMIAQRDIAMPDGAWTEGWHASDSLDYVQLGLHSSDFAGVGGTSAMAKLIEQQVANANHVSVFCTGYGPDGCHLVHRQGGGRDGAVVIHPTSGTAHILFFDFSNTQPF